MLNLVNYLKMFSASIVLFCAALNAVPAEEKQNEIPESTNQDTKMHVVLAMPFKPGFPFDPHWYTPEYITYIANRLPSDRYYVTGYFVSLENIPQFLDDMEALYAQEKNLVVLNFCDGGEWDGYPGLSVITKWKAHPVSKLIRMTGSDDIFILNSDNKVKMNSYIQQASLKALPQTSVPFDMIDTTDFKALVAKEGLDQHWPLFCKLNIGAGALGIGDSSICKNIDELIVQMKKMHKDYPISDILIQPYLPGPEYTILVLKDKVFAAVQRDFHNPYNLMLEDYLTGVRPPEEEITYRQAPMYAQTLALKVIQAIPGKPHYTRVDMRDDGKGNTYVIDINDRPGIGDPSTVKYMLDFNHLSESQLLQDIVETASILQ